MSFRRLNQKYLVPGAQTVMILGIIALCQPWNLFLHRYGVTITLIGLVSFIITSHIPPEQEAPEEDAHEGRLAE
ncbi:hypothetical protein [Chelativorans salis]|uniref:Uncharacterized protein n=1 Tax=Chelativorans salis TaxID=2978478 RepID=A0ABT2LRE4_9HYPH|nr:hypothetical protein [Chelativorans sp. EGI FJ00035]MCT7377072.1 hypothetical protein [Chelativorans sp. EGI FJ00035]